MKLATREVVYEWPARPLLMGIVNLSVDSFSGDGTPVLDAALESRVAVGRIDPGLAPAAGGRIPGAEAAAAGAGVGHPALADRAAVIHALDEAVRD